MEIAPYQKYTSEELYEDETARGPLRIADERLSMIEDKVGAGVDNPEQRRDRIDRAVSDLVKTTIAGFKAGKLSLDQAGSMLLIAVEKIDEYKDDDDPLTNGERIAAQLAMAPPELLDGPLRQFAEAEGREELVAILGEISRNDPDNIVQAV